MKISHKNRTKANKQQDLNSIDEFMTGNNKKISTEQATKTNEYNSTRINSKILSPGRQWKAFAPSAFYGYDYWLNKLFLAVEGFETVRLGFWYI